MDTGQDKGLRLLFDYFFSRADMSLHIYFSFFKSEETEKHNKDLSPPQHTHGLCWCSTLSLFVQTHAK